MCRQDWSVSFRSHQTVAYSTYLGIQVCDTSNCANSANAQSWYEPVTLTRKGNEVRLAECRTDSCNLCNSSARELDGYDVLVFAKDVQHLGVDVETSHDIGEVVQNDGDR